MALRLEPVVEQEYCGYWVNATAFLTPSLQGYKRIRGYNKIYIEEVIQIIPYEK